MGRSREILYFVFCFAFFGFCFCLEWFDNFEYFSTGGVTMQLTILIHRCHSNEWWFTSVTPLSDDSPVLHHRELIHQCTPVLDDLPVSRQCMMIHECHATEWEFISGTPMGEFSFVWRPWVMTHQYHTNEWWFTSVIPMSDDWTVSHQGVINHQCNIIEW